MWGCRLSLLGFLPFLFVLLPHSSLVFSLGSTALSSHFLMALISESNAWETQLKTPSKEFKVVNAFLHFHSQKGHPWFVSKWFAFSNKKCWHHLNGSCSHKQIFLFLPNQIFCYWLFPIFLLNIFLVTGPLEAKKVRAQSSQIIHLSVHCIQGSLLECLLWNW